MPDSKLRRVFKCSKPSRSVQKLNSNNKLSFLKKLTTESKKKVDNAICDKSDNHDKVVDFHGLSIVESRNMFMLRVKWRSLSLRIFSHFSHYTFIETVVAESKRYTAQNNDSSFRHLKCVNLRNFASCWPPSKYLHFMNKNNPDKSNRFSKLTSLFDKLNNNFMQFGVFSNRLSVDEEIVHLFWATHSKNVEE